MIAAYQVAVISQLIFFNVFSFLLFTHSRSGSRNFYLAGDFSIDANSDGRLDIPLILEKELRKKFITVEFDET